MYSVPRFAKRRKKRMCRCLTDFKSWEYVSEVPNPRVKSGEYHLWRCLICDRRHLTMDKRKPSPTQRERKIWGA